MTSIGSAIDDRFDAQLVLLAVQFDCAWEQRSRSSLGWQGRRNRRFLVANGGLENAASRDE
jgi:hypothetical protein